MDVPQPSLSSRFLCGSRPQAPARIRDLPEMSQPIASNPMEINTIRNAIPSVNSNEDILKPRKKPGSQVIMIKG